MSKSKKTGVSAPGSDETQAKKIMVESEARRMAFCKHMGDERIPLGFLVERIAWEAFKAGEKFGRSAK